ncbi:PRC-barrel domain-containing protein [Streptomyces sp. NPDC087219]|uniref:PRC-barrel domain-containing protein n=1 Tax=Streptomyces sp. NPDC087219 TaxID=3365770 RepID=UPI003804C54F
MIGMADIREWRTHDVLDAAGRRIGVLEAVHVDTSTGEPAMVTVQIGLPTRHRLVFVPLDGASVGPGHVKGAHDKALVKDRPSIGMGDVLPFEDEEAVFQHYGLPHQLGPNGELQLARR